MARIWQQGFEIPYRAYATKPPVGTYNYEDYSIITSGTTNHIPAIGMTTGRSSISKYCYCFGPSFSKNSVNTGSAYLKYTLPNIYTNLYFRFWFKSSYSAYSHEHFKIFDSNDNLVFSIKPTNINSTTYTLSFINGTTTFFTSSAISVDTWLKIDFNIDITNNTIIIKIDDRVVHTYSATLTGTNMSYLMLGCISHVYSEQQTRSIYFDDIVINDTSGSVNNSWGGNGTIVALQPISNGSLVEFTPLSGSNYANVDEITASDGDTTYNSISESEKTDLFKVKKLSDYSIVDTTKINAVSIIANAKFNESASAIAPIIKGTNATEGNKTTISGEYTSYNLGLYNVNPETSTTFTAKDLADLEFGYRSKDL